MDGADVLSGETATGNILYKWLRWHRLLKLSKTLR
jgi:hypothetical protein